MNWLGYSLLAMLGFSGVIVFLKALTDTGLKSEVINFYFFSIVALGFLALMKLKGTSATLSGNSLRLFPGLGVVAVFANYYSLRAYESAPNPAFVGGIQTLSLVFVGVVSIWLFGAELTVGKFLGLLLCVFGAWLVRS